MLYQNLPKGYKRLALQNRKKQHPQNFRKDLSGSLMALFTFTETPEGFEFWYKVAEAQHINELPPLHKTRRVTYEENRR